MNISIVFASVFVIIGLLFSLTLFSPLTTNAQKIIGNNEDNLKYNENLTPGNKYTLQKTCGDSFLAQSKGGPLPQDIVSDINRYLSQNPIAIGDEPLTKVKNVDGLCILINLAKSEGNEERIANEEQIRNILNAALQEKQNQLVTNGIINNLLQLGLIESSND
ncbi:MAG TPA: hypothetical protein VJ697_14925 [Nitrososphaeraceae archaeon]|nr:hypothetical protein [Nitrososphaeraceae archaeon]